jgi:Holliday junction DNA helicase RuvA
VIASIRGRVIGLPGDGVVIEVSQVGLKVGVPAPLRARLHLEDPISLFTYLVVREDALTLYGFETQEECDFFALLLRVNGIGPRLAINLLSSLSPASIRQAVLQNQADIFGQVPGFGHKTAQKIILHLQDHIKAEPGAGLPGPEGEPVDSEVLNALITLGYSVIEAQSALQALPKDTPKITEERLRLALQSLAR